jgi:hypothetical protein
LLALLVLVACADPKPATTPTTPARPETSSADRYFPLEEGKIYHYTMREGAETGMLVAKVHRTDPTHGELRIGRDTKRFVYAPDGVRLEGGAYLLKMPLDKGASWQPGEHGGTTRIESTDASVTVAAGTYGACIQTVEEGGKIAGAKYVTTYCPGVGMVLVEITAPMGEARGELKSYGFPVKIE